jgi:hypothetical protein
MELKLVVDRIEEETAVLLVQPKEQGQILWPVHLLPGNTQEGDILSISLHRDTAATRKALKRSADMIEKLRNKRL